MGVRIGRHCEGRTDIGSSATTVRRFLAADAERGRWKRRQTFRTDRLLAFQTDSIGTVRDPGQGGVRFLQLDRVEFQVSYRQVALLSSEERFEMIRALFHNYLIPAAGRAAQLDHIRPDCFF